MSVVCGSPACIVVAETVFFLVHVLDRFPSLKTPPQRAGHIDNLFIRKDWPPASTLLRRQPTHQREKDEQSYVLSSILTFFKIPALLLPRTKTHPIYVYPPFCFTWKPLSFKAFEVMRHLTSATNILDINPIPKANPFLCFVTVPGTHNRTNQSG